MEELVDEIDDGCTIDVSLSIVVVYSKLDATSVFIVELLLVPIVTTVFTTVLFGSYLNTLLDDVVDVTDDGVWFCDTDVTEPVSLLPRFLPANSYISPNIPAKVLPIR